MHELVPNIKVNNLPLICKVFVNHLSARENAGSQTRTINKYLINSISPTWKNKVMNSTKHDSLINEKQNAEQGLLGTLLNDKSHILLFSLLLLK